MNEVAVPGNAMTNDPFLYTSTVSARLSANVQLNVTKSVPLLVSTRLVGAPGAFNASVVTFNAAESELPTPF